MTITTCIAFINRKEFQESAILQSIIPVFIVVNIAEVVGPSRSKKSLQTKQQTLILGQVRFFYVKEIILNELSLQ